LLPLVAYISEILPIIFFLSFARRNRGEGLWVIFLYCLFSPITEIAAPVLAHKWDKFYLYAGFTIIEYTLFSFFFYISIQEKRFKLVPIIGTLIFYGMAVFNLINRQSTTFDSLSASVEAILIIVYCILFLYEQIKDPSVLYVYNNKKFWVVIAFFLYFSSTLFLFLYAATFTNQEHSSYWNINNLFEILKNILFCISFSMRKSSSKSYPLENLNPDI